MACVLEKMGAEGQTPELVLPKAARLIFTAA
jgi:hypothetical protein